MNIALSDTILYVTGKQGIENTSQQDLQTMVADYPYFAPAQLAYTAKLKSENSFKLQTQIQKAGLFFNNFKWLQYQMMEVNEGGFSASPHYNGLQQKVSEALQQENNKTITIESQDETLAFEVFEKESVEENDVTTVVEKIIETPIINEKVLKIENVVEDENEVVLDEALQNNYADFMPNISIPTVEDVKGIMNGIDEKNETIMPTNIGEGNLFNETDNLYNKIEQTDFENHRIDTVETDVLSDTESKKEDEKIFVENEVKPDINNEIETPSTPIIIENNVTGFEILEPEKFILPITPVNDIHAEIAALKANWYKRNELEELSFEPKTNEIIEQIETKLIQGVEADGLKIVEKIEEKNDLENKLSSNLASIKTEFNKPVTELQHQTLSFETEPYYTIDYFASQGIKFDITKSPQDKLTAKMLKFTDWLKKMKTTKPEINVLIEDPELDKAIQNIAATSNQTREVVTETMAEIFAKQGKTEKAIQLYIKLSFLIPEKSTYFADKLKELKGI